MKKAIKKAKARDKKQRKFGLGVYDKEKMARIWSKPIVDLTKPQK